MAENHADTWSVIGKATETTQQPAQKPVAKQAFSMVGSWTASLGNDAFAIKLTSDSKFQLVHIKSGKSTISKGKVTRSGNQMTLAGDDGTTLRCSVAQTTSDRFQLAIAGGKGSKATTLTFKKAK